MCTEKKVTSNHFISRCTEVFKNSFNSLPLGISKERLKVLLRHCNKRTVESNYPGILLILGGGPEEYSMRDGHTIVLG